jgi:hypothetical protein
MFLLFVFHTLLNIPQLVNNNMERTFTWYLESSIYNKPDKIWKTDFDTKQKGILFAPKRDKSVHKRGLNRWSILHIYILRMLLVLQHMISSLS